MMCDAFCMHDVDTPLLVPMTICCLLTGKVKKLCSQGFKTGACSFRQFKASVSLLLAGFTLPCGGL